VWNASSDEEIAHRAWSARYGLQIGRREENPTMRAAHTLRIGFAGVIALVLMAFVGAPAGAQDAEYVDVINTTLSRTTIEACGNEAVVVTTTNLQPGSEVSYTFFSDPVDLGTATADATGTATLTFDLPAGTTLGTHTVVAEGTNEFGQPDRNEVTVVVRDCSTTPPGGGGGGGTGGTGGGGGTDLARTGTDLSNPLRLAVVLFAAGAALILAARKRQARTV
jgi:hypothetical protein